MATANTPSKRSSIHSIVWPFLACTCTCFEAATRTSLVAENGFLAFLWVRSLALFRDEARVIASNWKKRRAVFLGGSSSDGAEGKYETPLRPFV